MDSEENAAPEAEQINQDPSSMEQEIARETGKQEFSEKEKAAFNLKKTAERAKEQGIDPAEVLGFTPKTDDDDGPVTRSELKKFFAEKQKDTAIELAEGIEDEKTRELTKLYLKRVVPSGDAREDLRFALLAVNSAKNSQILEEVGRSTAPRSHGTGSGAPAKQMPKEQELSKDEALFLKPPFSMTKEQIVAARTS